MEIPTANESDFFCLKLPTKEMSGSLTALRENPSCEVAHTVAPSQDSDAQHRG